MPNKSPPHLTVVMLCDQVAPFFKDIMPNKSPPHLTFVMLCDQVAPLFRAKIPNKSPQHLTFVMLCDQVALLGQRYLIRDYFPLSSLISCPIIGVELVRLALANLWECR